MCTTTTAPLQTLSADLNATSTPPDPSDLIAVSSVHLALWRAAVAADRHVSAAIVEALHAVLVASYHLQCGVVVRDRHGEGYYHEIALVEALALLEDTGP
jgi:hypothetical protein